MNPFLAFLILIPLLGTLFLLLTLIVVLIKDGLNKGPTALLVMVFSLILTGGIFGYLVLLFKKSLNPKSAVLEFPKDIPASPEVKKSFSNTMLAATYTVLIMASLILFKIQIKDLVGIICIILGFLMDWSAIQLFNLRKSELKIKLTLFDFHRQLPFYLTSKKFLSQIFLPFLICAVFFYKFWNGSKYISVFDLGGLLYFMISYGLWTGVRMLPDKKP